MKRVLFILFFSIVPIQFLFSQTESNADSTYWNREFHFGTTVFMDRKDLTFYHNDGKFLPGYSASYALKQIKKSGKGLILNFGINTFQWKSEPTDFLEFLSAEQIPIIRAKDYSLFRYSFSHLAIGYYFRKPISSFYLEADFSIGAQILSFTSFRDIRKYNTGAAKYLRDEQYLEANISPSLEFNTRISHRIAKRHLLFFNLKYIGFYDFNPSNYYSFLAFNLGLSKDFMLKKRKARTGKKFRDNYLYLETLGIAEYFSMNYERNISKYENFRCNLRLGYGYYESSNIIAGINLVLGSRIDRFELAVNYNYRSFEGLANPIHIVSTSFAYRAETFSNWMVRFSLGPAVHMQPNSHSFNVIFGASVGKKFGKN